jgi:hypothetical protein
VSACARKVSRHGLSGWHTVSPAEKSFLPGRGFYSERKATNKCQHLCQMGSRVEFLRTTVPCSLVLPIHRELLRFERFGGGKYLESSEVCSAILDSTRNILVLTADDGTYELPVGNSERLRERFAAVNESG